eukprot:8919746-Pyramimonas_sp.AAC.1
MPGRPIHHPSFFRSAEPPAAAAPHRRPLNNNAAIHSPTWRSSAAGAPEPHQPGSVAPPLLS